MASPPGVWSLCLLVLLLAPLAAARAPQARMQMEPDAVGAAEGDRARDAAVLAASAPCSAESQLISCGQLPVRTVEELSAYAACCELHRPFTLTPGGAAVRAAAEEQVARVAASVPRPDLDASAPGRAPTNAPDFLWAALGSVRGKPLSSCVAKTRVAVPVFTAAPRAVRVRYVTAPLLTRAQIAAVKAAAARQPSQVAVATRRSSARMRAQASAVGAGSAFVHPAGLLGPSELSLLLYRLRHSITPQANASVAMLTGAGVLPKFYRYNASLVWSPPTDTPVAYAGPYAMARFSAKWGGGESDTAACPSNFPAFAPRGICGHVAFVELDAQMSYKAALAYHTTRDRRYADSVFSIINAWARTNTAWGMPSQNGPLEAGWGVAALARSLEALRVLPEAFAAARAALSSWFFAVIHPQIDSYVVNSANAAANGNLNIYGNWHSTISEAWAAVAVLNDDAALFGKAAALHRATLGAYTRWGFDPATSGSRVIGECTETLRDVYHTLFGLGGLLQVSEWAWQQNRDLFSASNYALVAAMELHARIINAWDAGQSEALLPPGFRFYEKSMPAPPPGCEWAMDVHRQTWYARDVRSKAWVSDLQDGVKYILGAKWLPTGWEIGYNHFWGRLGIQMPETAALIKRYPLESHDFHWGQGTLTHADTASVLWRPGLSSASLCA